MAIQQINLGSLPLGAGGDSQRAANTKINQNFSNTAHAASRLVGVSDNDVPLVANLNELTFSRAGAAKTSGSFNDLGFGVRQTHNLENGIPPTITKLPVGSTNTLTIKGASSSKIQLAMPFLAGQDGLFAMRAARYDGLWGQWALIYNTSNTTKDSNGFIKASSPVLRVFSDHIEGNGDGEKMGAEFVKKGVGDYLIKGTTGLADEGWYVTVPQDANGNNLVAVEYKSLENGDVSLKTYKRKFDFETVSIVADTDNPLDIPDTRWIDLRFNEIEREVTNEPIE